VPDPPARLIKSADDGRHGKAHTHKVSASTHGSHHHKGKRKRA
jgi:hypothetical protein